MGEHNREFFEFCCEHLGIDERQAVYVNFSRVFTEEDYIESVVEALAPVVNAINALRAGGDTSEETKNVLERQRASSENTRLEDGEAVSVSHCQCDVFGRVLFFCSGLVGVN